MNTTVFDLQNQMRLFAHITRLISLRISMTMSLLIIKKNSLKISSIKLSQGTKHIDKTKINLGSEKRNVVPNGKFNRKYQIIVPNNFINI